MSITLSKSDFSHAAPGLPARRKEPQKHGLGQVFARATDWIDKRLDGSDSRRTPRLLLEFPDRFVNFRGMREFDFALQSRTEFPAARMRDLMALTPLELERSASSIRQVEREFAEILARAVHHPELIGEYLREIEIKLFSQDHGWREIMEGLIRLSPAYDAYKRVALIKYMQYLRARQNIMRSVFVEKTKGDDNAKVHATRQAGDVTQFAAGDTAIFDLSQMHDSLDDGGFTALAKGETVTVHLGREREMELVLAGNRLRLFTGRDCYMVDDDNNTHPLREGKNLIGRHSSCDVILDSACRAVSRNHLIVQPISAHEIRLTDISSHGTEIPAHLLHRR